MTDKMRGWTGSKDQKGQVKKVSPLHHTHGPSPWETFQPFGLCQVLESSLSDDAGRLFVSIMSR